MNEKMIKWKKIFSFLVICTVGLVSYFLLNFESNNDHNFAFAQNSSIAIITIADDDRLLSGAEYSITPDPFKMTGTLFIKDNSLLDSEKEIDGVISLSSVKNGNYIIKQTGAPSGYILYKISKTIGIENSSTSVTFTNNPETSLVEKNSIQNITYTAKFVCGSVFGDEGPLRPGHYDTDISIFNKQNFPIKLLWNVVVNDGPISNAIIKNLESETATGIFCKQVRELLGLGNNSEKLTEGFVVVRIQLDSILETAESKILRNISEGEINLLDVQVFYTANALPTLPHEVIVDKISFYIIQDKSGKIPSEVIRKPLDVSIPSQLNEISNTESRIKNILAEKYDLSLEDMEKIILRIRHVSVGVGSLIDDHAISLHVVEPQASS
ncbi:MAG: SpaA isopeptide-forming pilin-related protein [Nitrosopumilaceae archaeon]